MKTIFLAIFLTIGVGIGMAQPVLAENVIPEFNPVCWKKEDCTAARRGFNPGASEDFLKSGWVDKQPDCPGKEWGKCLPGGQTITTISFGGQNKFSDLGSFITQMYRYAIGVAGIIAVIVVTISGIQWAASGGSADVISSAKTRIGGALIGLALVYLSYTILNTINPNLVNFRLPSVWMLKPRAMVPRFCSQLSDEVKNGKNFALAPEGLGQGQTVSVPNTIDYNLTFKDEKPPSKPSDSMAANFLCGKQFFVQNGGSLTCRGNYCEGEKKCLEFGDTSSQPYVCKEAALAGTIFSSATVAPGCISGVAGYSGYVYPFADKGGGIIKVCRGPNGIVTDSAMVGRMELVNHDDKKTQSYLLTFDKSTIDKPCARGDEWKPIGYSIFLQLEGRSCAVAWREFEIGKNGKVLVNDNLELNERNEQLQKIQESQLFSVKELINDSLIFDIDVNHIKPD